MYFHKFILKFEIKYLNTLLLNYTKINNIYKYKAILIEN